MKNDSFWPALSTTLLVGFMALIFFICTSKHVSFSLYLFMFFFDFILFVILPIFLELSGYRKKIWAYWKKLPLFMHLSIVVILLFWTIYLSFKTIPKILKSNYEEN